MHALDEVGFERGGALFWPSQVSASSEVLGAFAVLAASVVDCSRREPEAADALRGAARG